MQIRHAQPSDLPALTALTIEAFRPLFEHDLPAQLDPAVFAHDHGRWQDDYRHEVPSLLNPEKDRFITNAEIDGGIAGYVGWNITDGDSGRLDHVAVRPSIHRRGVGSAVCRAALEELTDRGVTVVHVGTGGDLFHAPARALYESLGFSAYPVVDYALQL